MFEKFLAQNADDFRQRYEGTFGFYHNREDKRRMLVKLDSISDRSCAFTDVRGLEYRINADAAEDIVFEFLPPKAGFYNTESGVMFVQRVASRQFQRGISHRNTTIYLLSGTFYPQKTEFSTLEKIYEKSVPVKDALDMFEQKKMPAVAISSQLCLDSGTVWLLAESIGKYTIKNGVYILNLNDKSLFRTELTDAFKALDREVTFI